jgi:hypothetical protein
MYKNAIFAIKCLMEVTGKTQEQTAADFKMHRSRLNRLLNCPEIYPTIEEQNNIGLILNKLTREDFCGPMPRGTK